MFAWATEAPAKAAVATDANTNARRAKRGYIMVLLLLRRSRRRAPGKPGAQRDRARARRRRSVSPSAGGLPPATTIAASSGRQHYSGTCHRATDDNAAGAHEDNDT